VVPARRLAVSAEAMRRLSQQPFPGNVRELRNLLERTALLCDGQTIGLAHLELALGSAQGAPAGGGLSAVAGLGRAGGGAAVAAAPRSLHDIELAVLREQVRLHQGSRAELAARLGVSERSLYRKLRALAQADGAAATALASGPGV
jgi:DNA-binding NtrC family response regulator